MNNLVPSYASNINDVNNVVGIDIKGPIQLSGFKNSRKSKEFYILAIMYLFSRYVEFDVIFDINSETICKTFENTWLKNYQVPNKFLSDNGKQFISQNFKNLLVKYDIEHITSALYNPTGNSLVERANKKICIVLRLFIGKSLSELKRNIW